MRPPFLADPALQAVLAALPGARIVGGAVRDALASREVADIDLATPLPPESVIAALNHAGLKAIPTGLAHGTVTALSGGTGFEVTTLRRDVATDGRHATVAFTEDWRADAARRDFTINAMSMDADGAVADFFDGRADLRAGRVRFVGDPATRIAEDYLRILRFFRFWARYGAGDPDPDATAAIAANLPGLDRLSPERVWSELRRILAAPDPGPALALMDQLGVLDALLPLPLRERAGVRGETPPTARSFTPPPSPPSRGGEKPDPILRLAALGPRDTSRLRLSLAEAAELQALRSAPALPEDASPADLRRALADTAPAALAGRARLAHRSPALVGRIESEPVPVFPLQGRDLLAAGHPPGPAMGETLRQLRQWWLDAGCTPDRAACLAQLARLRPP